MRQSISSKKLYVAEVYTENSGWIKMNKKLTVKKIYEMFEDKEFESIGVIEDGNINQSDYNYITFRESFCTLQKYFEKILDEVKSDINLYLGLDITFDDLEFLMESTKGTWDGMYIDYFFDGESRIVDKKSIIMKMSLIRDSYTNPINKYSYARIKKVLYHEIGHYIHDIYFNNANMNLSIKGKSVYARQDHHEDFAESFMDLMISVMENEDYSIRNVEMMDCLKNKGIL